jgi:ABC-type oligopeptide transport system substrate-binding subunit
MKPKEQLEEEKKISLVIRIKPLDVDNLGLEQLKQKAQQLWARLIELETEKYDLEERQKRQDYDVSVSHILISIYEDDSFFSYLQSTEENPISRFY